MNVALTPQLENLVKEKVASGLYASASEVVREALRLLEEVDYIRTVQQSELKKAIQKGIDSGASTIFNVEEIKAKARGNIN